MRGAVACGLALLALPPATLVRAQAQATGPAATIGDLNSRQVEVHADTLASPSVVKAMANYRRFLELQNTDPRLRAEALRRLGDLNLDAGEMQRMQQEVTAGDLGGAQAIRLYTTLLKAYPDYARNDEVLYQLARAYEVTGQPDPALTTLDELVRRYPQTPELAEVQFRRGELLFSAKRYPEAERAYAAVIARGPSSGFYQQSLYKHGWSLFKESRAEDGLPSFGAVLDQELGTRGGGRGGVSLASLKRADRELVEDTLRVMCITFSANDGAASLEQYLQAHGRRAYEYLLYQRLGDLYVAKQRYQDAASTYRAYVARDPYTDEAPNLANAAIAAYTRGGFSQLVLDGKHEFVERYNFDSPFWKNRSRSDYPRVVAELKVNLKDVATYFHASAQKSGRIADYQEAARWYRSYLKSFPEDSDSAATNYLLAEALFSSHDYTDAAGEYEHTAYGYPKNDKSATAGYAALVCYQKAEAELTGAAQQAWHRRATDAAVKFAQTFPEHPDSAGVLTRADEEIFASGDHLRAISIAQSILKRQPPVDDARQRIAWTIIAQSHFDDGEYAAAEPAYVQARALAGADAKMQADLNERLAASVYEQGAAKQHSGDANGAIADYLRVASVAPGSKIVANAQYDAAAQLITLKQWDRAIGVLEDFRRQFPQNPLSGDATRKLAVAYSESNRPGEAALEFERIAADPAADHAVQREALLKSADLYAKAGNTGKSVSVLEKFVAANPAPLADAEEARQRLADDAARGGDTARRDYWYREIIKADGAAGAARTDRTHYLAAKAQLALSEPARDAFRSVRLTAPLKKSLERKRRALQVALDDYRLAADYQVAEVTTAATYEMAELYSTLAHDVLNSERPQNLKGDALDEYNALLEEQVFPFEEQAIKVHELNAARARNGVYDQWVKKSFEALAALEPARYGKTEQVPDVVATLD